MPNAQKSMSYRARLLTIVVLSLIVVSLLTPGRLLAADPVCEPDAGCLPAGLACNGFDLHYAGTGGDHQVNRAFTDRNGNLVRVLTAGKGPSLTFTNGTTGASLTLPGNGSVIQVVINADGSATVQSTGHTVLILFPTDIPAGPTTTLYIGRVVYTVDPNGVFSLQSSAGQTTDICAVLSS